MDPDDIGLRRVWFLSLVVSVGTVAGYFIYVNLLNWHNGIPLGYDSFYYVGWINQVVASGPLQFAASQHYVEFLYPIVASIPVYLGASADSVEIVLPAVLSCAVVVATGFLALESKNWKFAILTVAFSSGWFAVYRMGADFHGNLLALLFLLPATTLLIRVIRVGSASVKVLGVFLALVILAAAVHVETTDVFILVWIVAFGVLGRLFAPGTWGPSSLLVTGSALTASPFTFAYLQGVSGGLGGQYCVYPPYWLEVLGPAVGFGIVGIGVVAWGLRSRGWAGPFSRLLISWSILALAVGVLGYLTPFPIVLSDRTLLLLPLPFVSSLGFMWLGGHFPRFQGIAQTSSLTILAIVIPLLTAPVVYSYAAPHFRFFAEHGPSLVTCATK